MKTVALKHTQLSILQIERVSSALLKCLDLIEVSLYVFNYINISRM